MPFRRSDSPHAAGAGALIIGASQAGIQVAASLRQFAYEPPITLVGSEPHPPYQRPPLSKQFLSGDVEAAGLTFRSPTFYKEARIDLVSGERIAFIELSEDGASGAAIAESGQQFTFDRLALTVGGQPRRLQVPGIELDGVCYLRKLADADNFRRRLANAQDVVIIGGGFIGLETAAAVRQAGMTVTVVEAADRLLSRAVAPLISDFFVDAHTRRGVRVMLSQNVTALHGRNGHVESVELADGTVPADLVVVGIGLVPHTRLAEGLGLECAGGIVVDRFARTSNPAIVAAGDCTVLPHPLTGAGQVHIESVQNAIAQAQVAAATMTGRLNVRRTVPWFWSDQGSLKLQIAGLNAGYDATVLRGDPDTEQFSLLYYRDGRLIAVDSVNAPRDYMAVRKALADERNISPNSAGDTNVALKELLE